MMDGTQINVDVTAPGATIALALIFLKVIILLSEILYLVFSLVSND